jgi:hypothetical protein
MQEGMQWETGTRKWSLSSSRSNVFSVWILWLILRFKYMDETSDGADELERIYYEAVVAQSTDLGICLDKLRKPRK